MSVASALKNEEIMASKDRRLKAGQSVVLTELPPGLLNGLPEKDQKAISAIVGKPIRLVRYGDDGRVELEFVDGEGEIHFIYVNASYITPA
jgi:hypothetical protein